VSEVIEEARRIPAPVIVQRMTDPVTDESQVRAALAELFLILDAGFDVQVRLTGLGLDFSIALVMESLNQLLEHGGPHRTLWVEMESEDCRDVIEELLRRVRMRHSNIALQAGRRLLRYRPPR
jgi:hypothetical protein